MGDKRGVIFYIPKGGRVNTDTKIKYNAFKSLKSLLKRGKKLRRMLGLILNLRDKAIAMETGFNLENFNGKGRDDVATSIIRFNVLV
jgi:hypothetical protein